MGLRITPFGTLGITLDGSGIIEGGGYKVIEVVDGDFFPMRNRQ